EEAVSILVNEGPIRVRELIDLGAEFDRDPDGSLQLAREGGHSHARVVHAGGAATGAEIERALVEAVARTAVTVDEHAIALDLLVDGARCRGVRVRQRGMPREITADHVLLATGGAGQLFALTTNPLEATGDGLAMALRADVPAADVEFMQFHPTALAVDRLPRPLLSEALRGDGALLRNRRGDRFVDELQPRDIVARAITAEMLDAGEDHVWLDVKPIHDFAARFPSIARVLADAGLDPARDWLPVAPAAHYLCGGVVADLDGATALANLWAAGEVACSGVHGANRLASNSLLDGLVFGARVVDAITKGKVAAEASGAMRSVLEPDGAWPGRPVVLSAVASAGEASRADLQRAMTSGAGVLRDEASLAAAARVAAGAIDSADAETRNLAVVASALVAAASAREESRGAHARTDHPQRDDRHWRLRTIV
ncbi:MAG TPA: FAD-binding protein, partial [Acidimicrobiales bacterium]|nr:FAD-binding protein [Acidimicrobiales bacterium]